MMRYLKRGAALLMTLLMLAGGAVAQGTMFTEEQAQAAAERALQEEDALKAADSYTRVLTINGRNFLYFAQNSPEWNMLLASKNQKEKRTFGSSGCAVAALAIATANALPMERLREVTSVALIPVSVDSRSITNSPNHQAGRFLIEKDSDFLRFWPVVLDNITAQNNSIRIRENRSSNFYAGVLEVMGLRYQVTRDRQEMLDALDEGALAISCTGGGGSPYTSRSHYLTFAAKDEEYLYVLDPYARSELRRDVNHVIDVIEPGFQRVKLSNLRRFQTGSMYIIWPEADFVPYTPEKLAEIIAKSNAHQ